MNDSGCAYLDLLPAVARESIRARLEGRPPCTGVEPDGELARRAPVFVTLRIDGELRGCVGGILARAPDLVAETMDRALAAAFEDPRFAPISADELERCTIEVTILGAIEPVASEDELDPRVFGVIAADDNGRRGVLLPGIDGIETVAQQLAIVRRKAGIPDGARVSLSRFRTTKIGEAAGTQRD